MWIFCLGVFFLFFYCECITFLLGFSLSSSDMFASNVFTESQPLRDYSYSVSDIHIPALFRTIKMP